jgi:RimJ/RimL family protein N-acetyltransferase
VLERYWPTFGLRITTPRLELRVPEDHELEELAAVAERGVHAPGERPFLTPWTEGPALDRARSVLQGHWERLATWSTTDWRLGLGVFDVDDLTPLGMVTLRAQDFGVLREVATTSWLGLAHQRQGLGTQARLAVLTLAFDHLGAQSAVTEVFPDNAASQGVSRRLGYQPDGISLGRRGDEALVSDRLRLTREQWAAVDSSGVAVEGLDGVCRAMLGA